MLPQTALYLLDTSVLLHSVRDDALSQQVRITYSLNDPLTALIINPVIEGEMRSLALQSGWGSRRVERLDQLLARARSIPLDFPGVIDAYARIDSHCRRTGRPIGENDTWIAATAYATGARLLTTDRDFDHLDGVFVTRDWIDPKIRR